MLEPDFWFWLMTTALATCLPAVAIVLLFLWRNRLKKRSESEKDSPEESIAEEAKEADSPLDHILLAGMWLELGNYTAAMGELEQLPLESKTDLATLKLRCRVYRS